MALEPVRDVHDADSAKTDTDDRPTVVLESVFLPTGEHARREYPVEREAIPPGREPGHWLVLATSGDGRLLLDTDALRAVWTGLGSSPWATGGDHQ